MLVPFEANYGLFRSIISTGKKKKKKNVQFPFIYKEILYLYCILNWKYCFVIVLGNKNTYDCLHWNTYMWSKTKQKNLLHPIFSVFPHLPIVFVTRHAKKTPTLHSPLIYKGLIQIKYSNYYLHTIKPYPQSSKLVRFFSTSFILQHLESVASFDLAWVQLSNSRPIKIIRHTLSVVVPSAAGMAKGLVWD